MGKKKQPEPVAEYPRQPDRCLTPGQRRLLRHERYLGATNANDALLRALTDADLARMWCRIWDAMTYRDGYQPYGWDRPTLIARGDRPGIDALDLLDREAERRGLK